MEQEEGGSGMKENEKHRGSGETLHSAAPPPADCNLPPLSGAGSLRSP